MFIPTRKAVESVLELAKYTPEAAHHVYDVFARIVKKKNLYDKFKDFLSVLWNYVTVVDKQYKVDAPFDGRRVFTPAEVLVNEQYRSEMPMPAPEGAGAHELTFEIVSQGEGKTDRAYRQPNGEYASSETHAYIDYLLQLWMARNHIERKDQVMYEINSEGDAVRLSAADLQQKIEDPKHGFAAYVQKETRGRYGIKQVITSVQEMASRKESQSQASVIDPDKPGMGSSNTG